MEVNQVLDAKGLACPMPIVRTKKAMDILESGQILEVQVTDKGALADLTAWTAAAGHMLLEHKEEADVLTFYIRKA
nr:sulfurtransferase TusA family protein [Lysinibacillus timonensis]